MEKQIFNIFSKFPVFSLSGKMDFQIPCFPCAVVTLYKLRLGQPGALPLVGSEAGVSRCVKVNLLPINFVQFHRELSETIVQLVFLWHSSYNIQHVSFSVHSRCSIPINCPFSVIFLYILTEPIQESEAE